MAQTSWWKEIFLPAVDKHLLAECARIAACKANDVRQIGGILQRMMILYYRDVLRHARLAFLAALLLEVVAVLFFIMFAVVAINDNLGFATLRIVPGVLIQAMTAVVFKFYSNSARQFGSFHICLERTNRFLLANSMVEDFPDDPEKIQTRVEVVREILTAQMITPEMMGIYPLSQKLHAVAPVQGAAPPVHRGMRPPPSENLSAHPATPASAIAAVAMSASLPDATPAA